MLILNCIYLGLSSDSDEDSNDFLSMNSDAKQRQRQRSQKDKALQQSQLCVTVNIGHGLLFVTTPSSIQVSVCWYLSKLKVRIQGFIYLSNKIRVFEL